MKFHSSFNITFSHFPRDGFQEPNKIIEMFSVFFYFYLCYWVLASWLLVGKLNSEINWKLNWRLRSGRIVFNFTVLARIAMYRPAESTSIRFETTVQVNAISICHSLMVSPTLYPEVRLTWIRFSFTNNWNFAWARIVQRPEKCVYSNVPLPRLCSSAPLQLIALELNRV